MSTSRSVARRGCRRWMASVQEPMASSPRGRAGAASHHTMRVARAQTCRLDTSLASLGFVLGHWHRANDKVRSDPRWLAALTPASPTRVGIGITRERQRALCPGWLHRAFTYSVVLTPAPLPVWAAEAKAELCELLCRTRPPRLLRRADGGLRKRVPTCEGTRCCWH